MIRTMLSDPVFQVGIFGSVLGTIAVLLALRSQVGTHPGAVARGTRVVLVFGILSVLGVSGWSGGNAVSGQRNSPPASSRVSPVSSMSPTTLPTENPTVEPTPSPTPHLTRSITQVLTTFCQIGRASCRERV